MAIGRVDTPRDSHTARENAAYGKPSPLQCGTHRLRCRGQFEARKIGVRGLAVCGRCRPIDRHRHCFITKSGRPGYYRFGHGGARDGNDDGGQGVRPWAGHTVWRRWIAGRKLRAAADVTLNDRDRIMLDIVVLALSVVGVVRCLRQARGRAQPLPLGFWFCLALLISSAPPVFFDDHATVKTVAAVISLTLFLYVLSVMARSDAPDRWS